MPTPPSGSAAIAGLGITEMTRKFTKSAQALAVEAISLAIDDAGLKKSNLDGILTNAGISEGIGLGLNSVLGLRDLRLCCHLSAAGSTAGQMVQYASLAISAGMANVVACVFADAPLAPAGGKGSDAYGRMRSLTGLAGLSAHYGFFGANTGYALAARRHMSLYGTKSEQLGAIAVSNRKYAGMNPRAVYKEPITIEDYHASRYVVEPFHLLDCCMVNNGAVAVIVTSAERARSLKQPPAYVLGMGQGHPGNPKRAGFENEVNTGAVRAKETAFKMAGITTKDVNVCEFYDCYTYTTLVTLEDYGFAKKGEGGPFVATGALAPGGSLPTNTGGGQLSGYYMWGMTPISEAVIQTRGQGGQRQSPKHDVVLVSSQGGILDHHACLVLSPHKAKK
ncbi:MAG: thiolase family protein [Chloroflexi bacterium]|nr:thiolase family protein [Chloroflexota bacterium]